MNRLSLAALIALMAFSTQASAGITGSAKVRSALPLQTVDKVFFWIDKAIVGTPACNTQQRYVINYAAPGGPALYSAVLTALTTGAAVTIEGTGNCTSWGDSEGVNWVRIDAPQ